MADTTEPTPAELAKLAEGVYRVALAIMHGVVRRNVPPLSRDAQTLVLMQAMILVAARLELLTASLSPRIRAQLMLIVEEAAKSAELGADTKGEAPCS